MRRRKAKKIAILPDPMFHEQVVTKFVNNLMYSGKKSLAFKIFYEAIELIEKKVEDFGILICGSANGVAITANKHQGIRSALCWKKEIAELARLHNDANIMALPARFITQEEAIEMVDAFLTTAFEGGRHQYRINKIACG